LTTSIQKPDHGGGEGSQNRAEKPEVELVITRWPG
jgi:hypothetical protein